MESQVDVELEGGSVIVLFTVTTPTEGSMTTAKASAGDQLATIENAQETFDTYPPTKDLGLIVGSDPVIMTTVIRRTTRPPGSMSDGASLRAAPAIFMLQTLAFAVLAVATARAME